MKKLFSVLNISFLIVFFLLLFCGCKKDYVCFCNNGLIDTSGHVIHDTKKNAEKECKALEPDFKIQVPDGHCYIDDGKN